MIDRISLTNFQKHKKLSLKLGGITTLVGPSDKGKSSVLRAIRWALLGQPPRIKPTTRGETECRVAIRINSRVVKRGHSKKPFYQLGKETFYATAGKVPEAISDVVRLDDINFQTQHDPGLWFHLSAPEVARQINGIVDLEEIDTILKIMAAKKREAKKESTVAMRTATQAKTSMRSTNYAPEFLADVQSLDKMRIEYVELNRELEEIKRLGDDLCKAKSERRKLVAESKLNQVLDKIYAEIDDLEKEIHLIDRLSMLKKQQATKTRRCPECGQRLP